MRRWLAAVAAGVAAGALVRLALPAAAERTAIGATLVFLPLAAALLLALGRELRARPPGAAERLLGAAWLAAALWGDRLALPRFETLLVAALALLVAARVAGLLPALARRAARRRSRAAREVAVLAFAAGLALLPAIDARAEPFGDEPYFLLLAESLASDLDVDLADEYREGVSRRFLDRELGPQPGDPVGERGELLSRHESLLAMLLAPFWAAGGTLGARLAMLALWAATAGVVLRLGFGFGLPARGALAAALTGAFAPPFVLYAHAIWVDAPAALAAGIALDLWLRARGRGEPMRPRELVLFVAALAALPLLKLRLLGVALPIAALAALERGRGRGARLAALGAVALAGAAVLARNAASAGNALRVYEPDDLALHETPLGRYLLAADGLLFDLAFGLLAWAPLWLLALPAIGAALVRLRGYALAAAAFLPYFALVASRREWYGGWSPPFRYGLIAMPLVALGAAALVAPRRRGVARAAAAALGLATGLAALASVVEPGWVPSFADGRSRLLDLAAAPFAADLARLLPSALRPRPATWLVPLVALAAAVALARLGPARGRRLGRAASGALGAAALLAGAALALGVAHRLPTRVVEMEDPWLRQRAGTLFPGPWTFDRTRYDGGWTVPPGARVEVAPVPGGGRVAVRLRVRGLATANQAVAVELSSGGVRRGRWRIEPDADWSWFETGEFDWPPGGRLVVATRALERGTRRSAVVVDRIELDWR